MYVSPEVVFIKTSPSVPFVVINGSLELVVVALSPVNALPSIAGNAPEKLLAAIVLANFAFVIELSATVVPVTVPKKGKLSDNFVINALIFVNAIYLFLLY
jgi:hypothetical protein